jgi:hypothetical protein
MFVRLYFNVAGELPWSVDNGLGTSEQNFRHVEFYQATGRTRYEPSLGDNKNTPTAWIEFDSVKLEYCYDTVIISGVSSADES